MQNRTNRLRKPTAPRGWSKVWRSSSADRVLTAHTFPQNSENFFLVPRRERALEGDVQAWAGWVMTPWFGGRSLEKIATMIWHGS
jgi:hypothetical protein